MYPSLFLKMYQFQHAERLRESDRRRLIAQVVRERERPQRLEHVLSDLVYRLGLWLRINLTLQFAS